MQTKLCCRCHVAKRTSSGYCKPCKRWVVIKWRYGITEETYLSMVREQGGRCGICQRNPAKRGLVVDHDHTCCPVPRKKTLKTCGKCVRGLICDPCNFALGAVNDDVETLKAMVSYLEEV